MATLLVCATCKDCSPRQICQLHSQNFKTVADSKKAMDAARVLVEAVQEHLVAPPVAKGALPA